ncbi:MAG: hypothetical protein ACXWJB_14225 [Limisphaerales bacterium]
MRERRCWRTATWLAPAQYLAGSHQLGREERDVLTCARKLRMSPAFEGDMANGKATPQAFGAEVRLNLGGPQHDPDI